MPLIEVFDLVPCPDQHVVGFSLSDGEELVFVSSDPLHQGLFLKQMCLPQLRELRLDLACDVCCVLLLLLSVELLCSQLVCLGEDVLFEFEMDGLLGLEVAVSFAIDELVVAIEEVLFLRLELCFLPLLLGIDFLDCLCLLLLDVGLPLEHERVEVLGLLLLQGLYLDLLLLFELLNLPCQLNLSQLLELELGLLALEVLLL